MNQLENNDIKFWIEDGILFSEFKSPIVLAIEHSKAIVAMRHEISNNEKQYWCYSLYNVKSYTKESRDYAEKYGQDFLHATAVVVTSHLTIFIFNAFQKLNRPKIPLRAFKNREDAVTWLKELKQQNEK